MRHIEPLRSRCKWTFIVAAGIGFGLPSSQEANAQTFKGHRVTNRQITVNQVRQWERWQLPAHAVGIEADGWVRPHFSRGRYNVLEDLDTFSRILPDFKPKKGRTTVLNIDSTLTLDVRGNVITAKKKGKQVPVMTYLLRRGISRVGSNPAAAANILDGDPSTYWEPDSADPLKDWWVEVDLGRGVPIDSLVMKFVEKERGDPFRQFRVITAPFQKPSNKDIDDIRYQILDGTQAPNEDQRTFSFTLEELKGDPHWRGKLIEIIRIVVTDTKGPRGAVISSEEWAALDPSERGDIVHHVRNRKGFEEPLEKSAFDKLEPERQGSVLHFMRERPRLADIEAWGYGDNLSPGILGSGGGSAGFFGSQDTFSPANAFDGDLGTNFKHLVWSSIVDRGILIVDMGATFWLDAFRISSTDGFNDGKLIDGYIMRSSDGSRDSSGQLKWRRLSPRDREHNLSTRYEHLMDVYDEDEAKLRYIELTIVSDSPGRRGGYATGPNISEYQLFSRGYPAEAILTSDLIELPDSRNFGGISWDAEEPSGSKLQIRTRTGDLLGRTIRYFDKGGTEITHDAWANLLGSFKGPADTTFIPTTGWSPWSRPYQTSGDVITSPGLRKYMEIEVRLTTTDRDNAASIRSIDIGLVSPVAERVVAELWPLQISRPGLPDTFDVYIEPNFIEKPASSRSTGFDEMRLALPGISGLKLLQLGLEGHREEQVFVPTDEMGVYGDASGSEIQVAHSETGDSLQILLPNPLNILPEAPRTYNRLTSEGEQVPVSSDGQPLSGASYGVLDEEERGDILYFRRTSDASDKQRLETVSRTVYLDLDKEEQGPIRYFRILRGEGAQFAFNEEGDSLNATAYNNLSSRIRGSVVGRGSTLRARISAPIFLNGTTLEMAVRNRAGGAKAPWQVVEAGDASPAVNSNTLSIGVPLESKAIDHFAATPNPFTPNGDGINDAIEIRFAVFRIMADRSVRLCIYNLDGQLVWQTGHLATSGHRAISWPGIDLQQRKVPPGLYLCRIELDVDHGSDSATWTRLISVAY